jgi:hypothetical protein
MTKNVYDIYKTDDEIESQKGIELDFGSFSIRILRAGNANKKYTMAMKKHGKKYKTQLEDQFIENEEVRAIMIIVYAESVVIDWKGITDKTGKEMPFSKENCIKLFNDLPELFKRITQEAENFTNFKKEEIEKTKKS